MTSVDLKVTKCGSGDRSEKERESTAGMESKQSNVSTVKENPDCKVM